MSKYILVIYLFLCPTFALAMTCGGALTAEEVEASDQLALTVMREIDAHQSQKTDTVKGWLDSIKALQLQRPLTALEHVTLLYIYRSEADDEIREILRMSRAQFTSEGAPEDPLPAKVLATLDTKTGLFHEAIFASAPEPSRVAGLSQIKIKVNPLNVTLLALTAVSLTYEPGREIFSGFLVGLAEASLNEYLVHLGVGHAPNWAYRNFHRLGRPGKFMEEITLAHRLHHLVVSRYFGASVLPPEARAYANKVLRILSKDLVLERWRRAHPDLNDEQIQQNPAFDLDVDQLVASIKPGNYGVNGTLKGAAGMLITAVPYYLMNFAAFAVTGHPAFLVSSTVSLTAFIIQSLYSHRYMHIRPEDMGRTNTNAFMRWYLRTPVGRLQTRLHFVHHDLPWDYNRTQNGVIMAFSVADYFLKGGVQIASMKELLDMEKQGYFEEARP